MKPYYERNGITIYHGDCRAILPTLADATIDMIFTDPPYGHNNNDDDDLIARRELALGQSARSLLSSGTQNPTRPIANDGPEANELVRFLCGEARRLLMPGCCCCCCCGGGGGPDPQFARWSLWMDEALEFKQMVVWDKGPMGMGWHYRRSYEVVLVGMKPGAACRWHDESSKVENIVRHIPKIIPSASQHPTPKPVALAAHFVHLHAARDELVLDPFMGGGSTLEAAMFSGCRCIGVELDESYCEMAARRLEQDLLFS